MGIIDACPDCGVKPHDARHMFECQNKLNHFGQCLERLLLFNSSAHRDKNITKYSFALYELGIKIIIYTDTTLLPKLSQMLK